AGYMVGKSDTEFKPNDKLTRAEMATVLSRLVTTSATKSNIFKDIKGDEWYAQNIISMSSKGLIKGYEDKTFKPKNNITRTETMVILARMAKENNTYTKPQNVEQVLAVYKDSKSVPTWAKEEIAWAIETGLIKGDESNKLNMKNNITRAETAVVLCRLLELEKH
ncbi:MAG: S-layer homology domain-containing protein, partial [Cellulosilyticaceae bacterium]